MEVDDGFTVLGATIEEAKKRCLAVMDTVETLRLNLSCKRTLFRSIQSELSFLSRFSQLSTNFTPNSEPSVCVNIGHLEAVVHILQQPNISAVSCVYKKIPFPPSKQNWHGSTSSKGAHVDIIPFPPSKQNGHGSISSKGAHVDIVCTLDGNPVWFVVSDRNPKYISWYGQQDSSKNKGLQARVQLLLDVAHNSVALKPTSLIFFFANGLGGFTLEKFRNEFGAIDIEANFTNFDFKCSEELDGEWVDILARSYQQAAVLEIKVDSPENLNPQSTECVPKESFVCYEHYLPAIDGDVNLGSSFGTLISRMMSFPLPKNVQSETNLINFDTTALIAIVSGISNGNTQKLLATPEEELRSRFKGNYEFVIDQVMSEIQNPIHMEVTDIISGKKGIICKTVYSEFKELVSMCGGPNEKLRASHLLKHLMVIPDSPSERMMSLPTTRKLASKNKIVFGTGDYWHAPTLTANIAFVRAVLQTGMSLLTVEHRPRALTGD